MTLVCGSAIAQEIDPPALSIDLTVQEDGTATDVWIRGSAPHVGIERARELAAMPMPLSAEAGEWLSVLETGLPSISARSLDAARRFGLPPIDATIAVGNRATADATGWIPDFIGVNLQAFADTYGPADAQAVDRMSRIVAHEYLHLLTYARYPNHLELRQDPLDRALWTIFFEGIGDYVSISDRWLPGDDGSLPDVSVDALRRLEPILVERLELLANATDEEERELRDRIASGRFNSKWGSLTFALWLHREVRRCAENETLRRVVGMNRDSVWAIASRQASDATRERLAKLRRTRRPAVVVEPREKCLGN